MNLVAKPQSGRLQQMASDLTTVVMEASKPSSPQIKLVKGAHATQLFVSNGSRLHDVSSEVERRLEHFLDLRDEASIAKELEHLGLSTPVYIEDSPLESPPLFALSLAIAQKCNLGCSYCYAEQGDFGGPMKNMPLETAYQAIDMLLDSCEEKGRVQITFLGGEPMINRTSIRLATDYALEKAKEKDIKVGFSLTTNGTLLTEEDAVFFEKHGFSLTLSLDGLKDSHDLQRPLKGGKGSFDTIMANIQPFLKIQRNMQVSVRVTVTPQNLNLSEALDAFVAMGFHSIGFSPLLKSSSGHNEMGPKELNTLLENMIACGLTFERHVLAGKRYPFLNMINALKEIAKNTHRPYPCGAGAGYMGVSADGDLAACHRFVNEPRGKMGDLKSGVSADLQNEWLRNRHVHQQQPCTQCWAKYLCGGGCHHEVIDKGRTACDFIRGWLYYTLQAHARLSSLVPDWHKG